MIYYLSLAASMFLAIVAEHYTGQMPGLGGHIYLLPVIFFFAAAALPLPSVFVFAVIAGLMWDSNTVHPDENGKYEAAFGWSVALYGALGAVMNGLRAQYLRGRWEMHCLLTGVLTATIVLIQYLVITFRREPFAFEWSREVWQRIGGTGLAAALLAIPAFSVFTWLGRRLGVIKFDTMRPD
jgi:small basic protein